MPENIHSESQWLEITHELFMLDRQLKMSSRSDIMMKAITETLFFFGLSERLSTIYTACL